MYAHAHARRNGRQTTGISRIKGRSWKRRAGATLQPRLSPRLGEKTEIIFVVHSHSLTWLSCNKTFACKMRAAERSGLTGADREKEARGTEVRKRSPGRQRGRDSEEMSGRWERRVADLYCGSTWYVFKVLNDTSYHCGEGSGACQLRWALSRCILHAEQLPPAHTPPPPPPPPTPPPPHCNSVKSASRPVTHQLE